MGKTYAYIRVSSKDQKEARQIDAIRDFGVEERYMVIDKPSGKDFDRPGYRKLMKKLKPEDTLVIKSNPHAGRILDAHIERFVFLMNERRYSFPSEICCLWILHHFFLFLERNHL